MARNQNAKDYLMALSRHKQRIDQLGPAPNRPMEKNDDILDINLRIQKLLGICNTTQRKANSMLFFVMYDIESNKVRRYIVKYLEKQGCTRVQKSIFLADLEMDKYRQIKEDLAEVQAAYDNQDSIMVVPISTDYLRAMKIIGQSINIDLIMHSKSTLFF